MHVIQKSHHSYHDEASPTQHNETDFNLKRAILMEKLQGGCKTETVKD